MMGSEIKLGNVHVTQEFYVMTCHVKTVLKNWAVLQLLKDFIFVQKPETGQLFK